MRRRESTPPQPPELVTHLEHSMARFLAATRALMQEARVQQQGDTLARLRGVVWDAVRKYDAREFTAIPALALFGAPLMKVRVTRGDFNALMRWGRWTATHFETLKKAKFAGR